MIKNIEEAYMFQKHAIHHLSHELKTPISILVSNFEKIEKEKNLEEVLRLIAYQKEDTKNLGEIIDALLELSKIEANKSEVHLNVRIDELLFGLASELKSIYPDYSFSIHFDNSFLNDSDLQIKGHPSLLKSALRNLMPNCIHYSHNNEAAVFLKISDQKIIISLENTGITVPDAEQVYMFKHFFRGSNAIKKRGFGLGLVFVATIIKIHGGDISYQTEPNKNIFHLSIPLS